MANKARLSEIQDQHTEEPAELEQLQGPSGMSDRTKYENVHCINRWSTPDVFVYVCDSPEKQ